MSDFSSIPLSEVPDLAHPINPMVDFVFKALLGDPANKVLLLDFLNSILKSAPPIVDAEIADPFNDPEFKGDIRSIVDIKVRDKSGSTYIIEVQIAVGSSLPNRMLFSWGDNYRGQMSSGQKYAELRPVVAIWLLAANMLPTPGVWHHTFSAYDPVHGVHLSDHLAIHVLELRKWEARDAALTGEDRWLYFFREAKSWRRLPSTLDVPVMRRAMDVLRRFSEKEVDYHRYQARETFLREQAALQDDLERLRAEREEAQEEVEKERAEKEKERAEKEKERAEKEKERAEKDRLREKLLSLGIDPDA